MELLPTGTHVAGYRVEALLGQGGMGAVYLARQLKLNRLVALKVIAPARANDPDLRERFRREGLAAATIDHPHIVPVYEADEVDGLLFLAMRFVDGVDLATLIEREPELSLAVTVRVIAQVASALDAAHARGLLHRDVKPANVLVVLNEDESHAYLGDFGIARRIEATTRLTRTGAIVGTVDYMAPEVLRGDPAGPKADGYSLGCVLFECLTGEVPFPRDSDAAVIYAHLTESPPPIRERAPQVPEALERVVQRAMAKDPAARYATTGDLGNAAASAAASPPGRSRSTLTLAGGSESLSRPRRPLENRPTNLPTQLTTLVGRQREVEQLVGLLERRDARLITLTGPGGAGKTRLALQVAAESLESFDGGVLLVALAPISEPELLLPTVAQVLGVREHPSQPLEQRVAAALADHDVLLVLDNFEHLMPAARTVGELLVRSGSLTVLATSREALRVAGEQEFPVPLLEVPARQLSPEPAALSQYASVALFLERARAVDPAFAVTADNAPAVAEICVQLEGLPLAIELAAARVRMLPPRALLARLEHRLRLLGGGSRDAPDRQRTLRGAIDWSYRLLAEPEQRLLARLSVFSGGWTLDGAEAICDDDGRLGLDVFEGMCSLLEKNLIRRVGSDDERFSMLATIRDYAAELLDAAGEGAAVRLSHAEYFAELARSIDLEVLDTLELASRLADDLDNLRMAVPAALAAGDADLTLTLATSLGWVCNARGLLGEARRVLDDALKGAVDASAEPRARALALRAELHRSAGSYGEAERLVAEAEPLALRAGSALALAEVENVKGVLAETRGDFRTALEAFERMHTLSKEQGWPPALDLAHIGAALLAQGDHAAAVAHLTAAMEAAIESGLQGTESHTLIILGRAALEQGSSAEAKDWHARALAIPEVADYPLTLGRALEELAAALFAAGEPEEAARLWGAAERLRNDAGAMWTPFEEARFQPRMAEAIAQVGKDRFAAAWEQGRRLTPEQARLHALEAAASSAAQSAD